LNGLPGQNMFNDINSDSAKGSRFLTTNAAVTGAVTITDTGKLSGDEYSLSYTGSGYQLTNLASGKKESFADLAELNAGLEQNHGISLDLQGTPATGDEMRIRPTRMAASELKVAIGDGKQIAASGQVMAVAD